MKEQIPRWSYLRRHIHLLRDIGPWMFFIRLVATFAFGFSVWLLALPAQATSIQEIVGKNGVKAWLVEDHKLPLLAMRFAFRGGVEQDPITKQGLANLTTTLLTQGAGPYNAAAFQQQLADHSVAMSFSAGRDTLGGNIKTLSVDKDKAFELLHLALKEPRFDKKTIERARSQQLAALRVQLGNPEWQVRYALFQQIFASHPYGERRLGSTETLASLTESDIKTFAATHLARDNVVVAVAGDITPAELGEALDKVFGDLPDHARLAPVPEILWPKKRDVTLVSREGTQTELLFAMPAPKRDDAGWFAAEIANYILGGGGFSSRLMKDVRDDKGLTYGINTTLSPMEHGGMIVGEAATDNPKTGQAWNITLDTLRHFYTEGVTEKEMKAAKDYLTGALPLAMTSTDKIADVLAEIQIENLGRDYLDRRNDLIRNVTPEDVSLAIKRWFTPDELILSMVGKPDGVAVTQRKKLAKE